MKVSNVAVLGCGLMGSGIAQVCAQSGRDVTVVEVSQALLDKGLAGVRRGLDRLVEKGKLTAESRDQTMARLRGSTSLDDAAGADIVIEAVVEILDEKKKTYARLDSICKPGTIFASNTSSLSITEMASATSSERQTRFIGMHFFNPVPVMKLVEVVRTILTDPEEFDRALTFARDIGKTPVQTTDRTGFIVNRLLVPFLLDAIRAVEDGVGSIVDIDNGMKLGCGHPMGPLTLLDFVGLDTTYLIANIMFDEFREKRFAPPPLLKRMVMAGLNGRKAGRGFYDYSDPANPKPLKLT
ncbi:MAG TPA: 3-hydroxybutyryl-CoA dehydrogenase [Blastocatellia bacterium]|nr:3-hydroxybutyryl-CoA dehydrogenase [Blastocatellia bacterium]